MSHPMEFPIPLEDLLGQWVHPPLGYLKKKDHLDLPGYWKEGIRESVEKKNGFLVDTQKGGIPVGCAVFCELPWDSGYFQKRMGALQFLILSEEGPAAEQTTRQLLEEGILLARQRGWEFLLYKCDSIDTAVIHALENQGFLMMDTLLEYVYDFEHPPLASIRIPKPAPDFIIRPAQAKDCEELMHLARRSFGGHFGRFHADPRLPASLATGVYAEWVRSSFAGWADWIVVAETQGKLAGFSVWKKPSPEETRYGIPLGHYSIGAVGPEYQNQGLFRVLTYEGMNILQSHCRYIEGPTHLNNQGAQRGYQALGWKITGGRHAFHKWLV